MNFVSQDDTFTCDSAGEYTISDFGADFDQVFATLNAPSHSQGTVGAAVCVVAHKSATAEVTYRVYRRTSPTANTIEPAAGMQVTVSTLLVTH